MVGLFHTYNLPTLQKFACLQTSRLTSVGGGGPPPPSPCSPPSQWIDNQPTYPRVEDSLLKRRTRTYTPKHQLAYSFTPPPRQELPHSPRPKFITKAERLKEKAMITNLLYNS